MSTRRTRGRYMLELGKARKAVGLYYWFLQIEPSKNGGLAKPPSLVSVTPQSSVTQNLESLTLPFIHCRMTSCSF
jgi:hypothetical protein